MYKVGDKVRVKEHLNGGTDYGNTYFGQGMEKYRGKNFKISRVGAWKDKRSRYELDGASDWDWSEEMLIKINSVEESKEMTFPEMVQKLIDGEFEVGTELVNNDLSYFVDETSKGYGLKPTKKGSTVTATLGSTAYNSKWSVKEQPIKGMSIEEIEKELGYKIKIVE